MPPRRPESKDRKHVGQAPERSLVWNDTPKAGKPKTSCFSTSLRQEVFHTAGRCMVPGHNIDHQQHGPRTYDDVPDDDDLGDALGSFGC